MQATYKLAINGPFEVRPFGPLMTLDQAESYQKDMALANVQVLIVNTATDKAN